MANFIESHNGKIFYNTPVQKIVVENGRATGIILQESEHVKLFDEIISTMPFTDLIVQIPGLPTEIEHLARKLKYRNTVMVYLKVEGLDLFDDNWLYVHSTDLQMGRVTNFRNWIPELYGKTDITVLALEYWCYDSDELWHYSDEEYILLAKTEIQKAGLIKDKSVSDGFVYKVHRSYPTYHKGYKNDLTPLEEYVRTITNLQCIGRYGAFKYNNQDHSLLMGILAAENINELTDHNLWKINTDYDSYQESSLITETGLEEK
jgi:protoporphyrinogen oxidase